jgi:hypothetical protein
MISVPFGRRFASPTSWCFREPTITEMLADSIVMAMMEADGVDPLALEAELRAMAQSSAADRCAGPWIGLD